MKSIDFDGKAIEYFGIWIANIVLNVVTLGIFSAWAKVRKLRFFYNNTKILGNSLSYHATGWQILKGRIIAVVVIIVLATVYTFWPLVQVVSFPAIVLILPWIINSSLRFTARMVSYRNVRFNWHGNYGETLLYFVLGPAISFFSLGLLHPFFTKHYYSYYANNHSYGTSRFQAESSVKSFYLGSIRSGLIPCLFVFYSLIIFFFWQARHLILDQQDEYVDYSGIPQDLTNHYLYVFPEPLGIFLIVLIPVIIVTNFIYRIVARNILLRTLALSNANEKSVSARFDSTLNPFVYLWIVITNSIVVPFTLGLMSPWAQIRFYKYLCSCTKMEATGNLDSFVDTEKKRLSSLGQEYSEMEGFEVSI